MPIEKPKIEPELKEYTQKKLLRFFLIVGTVLTGTKGIEGIVKQSIAKNEFPASKTQSYEDSLDKLNDFSDENFNIEGNFGKRVNVSGTGSDGLFLRREAGKNAEILASAWDGESFIATGKTAKADGLLWYEIVDENENRYWAASDYLEIIN